MEISEIAEKVRSFLAETHKGALDEFALAIREITRIEGGFRVSGRLHIYSEGSFLFKLGLFDDGVKKYEREPTYTV